MEAKVDLRKLQLLNDRINQTIEALNQVRLSVYGLQHTSGGVTGQIPTQQGGIGAASGIGGMGIGGAGAPFGYGTPFGAGLSHTGGLQGGQNPWFAQQNPWTAFNQFSPFQTQYGYGQLPWHQLGLTGISHTSPDIEAMRVSQTFPYVFASYNPFVNF